MATSPDKDSKSAWQLALRVLNRRDRSETQIRSYLATHEFSSADIDATIERLVRERCLDDRRFAAEMAESLARRGRGSLRARRDLAHAGIGDGLIEETIDRVFAEERDVAQRVLATRYPELSSIADRARAGRFLVGRGFPQRLVWSLVGHNE